jgi:TPP-dependent 2-oxoacid decarboxylase
MQGAAFMASATAITGNPAACLGTLGPGATNLIAGVADANMDHAPMLVLTGQGSTRRLHKESHQVMDVVGMFEPVTKWSASVRHPDNIPEMVRKAVRVARTEKPGAVLIELPEDLAKLDTDGTPLPVTRFRRAVADDKVVDRHSRFCVTPNIPSSLPATVASDAPVSSCGCSVKKRASVSSTRSWRRVASTWTPTIACIRSGSVRRTGRTSSSTPRTSC